MSSLKQPTESSSPWVDGLTIGDVFDRTVGRWPERDAVVFPKTGLRWTWREFAEQVNDAARGLVALGLKTGDHVAIWSTNTPEWVVIQFATAKLGIVLVTINPAHRPLELKYVLRQSDWAALVLTDRFKTSDYYAMLAEACPEAAEGSRGEWSSEAFPKLKHVVTLTPSNLSGAMTFKEMVKDGQAIPESAVAEMQSRLRPLDPINIQYTSGTTGFPKAAMLSHRNLLLNAYHSGVCQELTHEDRICIPVPFYHCFGCVLGTLMCAVHGSAIIAPAEFFHPGDTLTAIDTERATVLYGVPTMFIAQLQDPSFETRNLSSLRTGIMAGSPCPIEIMRQVIERMGANETIGYGLTEASPIITQTRPDDSLERRVETVGRPLPDIEVKVVDPATGETLGENVSGELCTRGHVVMLGYYGDPAATAAAIDADGWLHSGDLAMRLPSGHYRITGRKKDMVIRGGENISPREIEEFLFTHPAIEQAAVVGVPDEKFGEELCAWVKLKAGASLDEQAVRAFCRQNLAHYKTPRYVKFVEAFPQTVTGKIQKFKIRETMIEELGLKQAETA